MYDVPPSLFAPSLHVQSTLFQTRAYRSKSLVYEVSFDDVAHSVVVAAVSRMWSSCPVSMQSFFWPIVSSVDDDIFQIHNIGSQPRAQLQWHRIINGNVMDHQCPTHRNNDHSNYSAVGHDHVDRWDPVNPDWPLFVCPAPIWSVLVLLLFLDFPYYIFRVHLQSQTSPHFSKNRYNTKWN